MAQATLSCRYAAIHLVYHGFYSSRGRKFPNGNFRTSVFCEVRTQIVGENVVSRQSKALRFAGEPFAVFTDRDS